MRDAKTWEVRRRCLLQLMVAVVANPSSITAQECDVRIDADDLPGLQSRSLPGVDWSPGTTSPTTTFRTEARGLFWGTARPTSCGGRGGGTFCGTPDHSGGDEDVRFIKPAGAHSYTITYSGDYDVYNAMGWMWVKRFPGGTRQLSFYDVHERNDGGQTLTVGTTAIAGNEADHGVILQACCAV